MRDEILNINDDLQEILNLQPKALNVQQNYNIFTVQRVKISKYLCTLSCTLHSCSVLGTTRISKS